MRDFIKWYKVKMDKYDAVWILTVLFLASIGLTAAILSLQLAVITSGLSLIPTILAPIVGVYLWYISDTTP